MKLRRPAILVFAALLAGLPFTTTSALAVPQTTSSTSAPAAVEPQAKELLQKMSNYLASLPELSVRTDGVTQVVRESGQRLDFDYSSVVRLRRPNHLRSDRRGDLASVAFYYDGKVFTLFGKDHQYFAQAAAPPTLDQALDAARDRYGLEVPAADLLLSRPYEALMEDVVAGSVVGRSLIDDVPCTHLAFVGNESDWQIWIENDATPLPRKLVIISKKVRGNPEFSVTFSDWNVAPKLDDSVFRFVPPAGAKKIDFLPKGGAR